MGFWIFMLVTALLVPGIMLGFGYHFRNHAPGNINMFFGYRTPMSMKNDDTWLFAHQTCGRLWVVLGWVVLVLSFAAMFVVLGRDEKTVAIFGTVLSLAQCGVLIASIFPVETALNRTFDKDGNRR